MLLYDHKDTGFFVHLIAQTMMNLRSDLSKSLEQTTQIESCTTYV